MIRKRRRPIVTVGTAYRVWIIWTSTRFPGKVFVAIMPPRGTAIAAPIRVATIEMRMVSPVIAITSGFRVKIRSAAWTTPSMSSCMFSTDLSAVQIKGAALRGRL